MKTKILNLKNRKDISTLRRIITEEKINILKVVYHKKPTSIKDLAKRIGRDYRNTYRNVIMLKELKLLKLKKYRGAYIPIVEYGALKIEMML